MAKERATDKSKDKKTKEKKVSVQDKVTKSSSGKDRKEKKDKTKKKAEKIAQVAEELDSKPVVDKQVKSEDDVKPMDEDTNESSVTSAAQDKKGAADFNAVDNSDAEDKKQKKRKRIRKKGPKKESSEKAAEEATEEAVETAVEQVVEQTPKKNSKKSPKKDSGQEGGGEITSETASKGNKGQAPAPSGLNRAGRRRLLLIDRQRVKIQERMGIPPESDERKEEVDQAVEEWTKTFDELNAKNAERKKLKALKSQERRVKRDKKRKEMGLSKKVFDKLERKEGKKGAAAIESPQAAPAA